LELLLLVQRDAGRLLAVAQRRVEDTYSVFLVSLAHAVPIPLFSGPCLLRIGLRLRRPPRAIPPEGGGGEVAGRAGTACVGKAYTLARERPGARSAGGRDRRALVKPAAARLRERLAARAGVLEGRAEVLRRGGRGARGSGVLPGPRRAARRGRRGRRPRSVRRRRGGRMLRLGRVRRPRRVLRLGGVTRVTEAVAARQRMRGVGRVRRLRVSVGAAELRVAVRARRAAAAASCAAVLRRGGARAGGIAAGRAGRRLRALDRAAAG